jgi:hypothetical protein
MLPWPLRSGLEVAVRVLFDLGDRSSADFLQPAGEAALVSHDSVSWRVFGLGFAVAVSIVVTA